jgi:anti-sigma B factor antagonist
VLAVPAATGQYPWALGRPARPDRRRATAAACVCRHAAGDIDLANAARFQAALTEAAATSGMIIADLTAVTYCDSAAINALFAAAQDHRLTLVVPEIGPITTMLQIAGLDQVTAVITVQ